MMQVGDIKQVMLKICLKYDKATSNYWFSTKFCDDALK